MIGSSVQPVTPSPPRGGERPAGDIRHSYKPPTLSSNQSAVQCLCILDRDARRYWLFANVISL